MRYFEVHDFKPDISSMKAIQEEFRQKITFTELTKVPKVVCGVDLSIIGNSGLSVIVALDFNTLELIELAYALEPLQLEYIPGFLAFRELPVFLKAWEKLKTEPDVVFFDGHGYAHPRRMGIATHASFFINKPTVGIGKSLLVGKHDELPPQKGSYRHLIHKNEIIGAALRTKDKVNPVYISAGNFITLAEAIELSLRLTGKYKLPDVTRLAHNYTQSLKKTLSEPGL